MFLRLAFCALKAEVAVMRIKLIANRAMGNSDLLRNFAIRHTVGAKLSGLGEFAFVPDAGVDHYAASVDFEGSYPSKKSGQSWWRGIPVIRSISSARDRGTEIHCEMAPGVMPRSFANWTRRPRSALKYAMSASMSAACSTAIIEAQLLF